MEITSVLRNLVVKSIINIMKVFKLSIANYRTLLGLFFFLLFSISLNSRHLVGGTAAYKVKGNNGVVSAVEIDFYILRDELGGGANFDNPATIGVYGYKFGNYSLLSTLSINTNEVIPINLNYGAQCPLLEYSLGKYSFDVTLSNTEYEHYLISYTRCCRPPVISNISNPDEAGFAVTLMIYREAFEFDDRANELDFNALPYLVDIKKASSIELGIDDAYIKKYNLSTPFSVGGVDGVNSGDPTACTGITPDPAQCPPPYGFVEYLDAANHYGIGSEVNVDENDGMLDVLLPMIGNTLIELTIDRYSVNDMILSSVRAQWNTTSADCDAILSASDAFIQKINVMPNPVQDILQLTETIHNVQIVDVSGRVVQYLKSIEAFVNVDVQNISPGFYTILGETNDGKQARLTFIKSDF